MSARLPQRDLPLTGLLLAAGRGARAGGTKQALPWVGAAGVTTLVAAAFDCIATVCATMIVVVGHEAPVVAAALGDRPHTVVESAPDAPMSHSLTAGLRAALELDANRSVLLHLGDHPSVRPATLGRLIRHARRHPGLAAIPEHRGRGGHPVLIPAAIARLIVESPLPKGLRRFWAEHPDLCIRFEADDSGVVSDLDSFGPPSNR